MAENRDPIECSSCQTVNAWMSEECRSCGHSLNIVQGSEAGQGDATSQGEIEAEEISHEPQQPDLAQSSGVEGESLETDDDTETIRSGVPPTPDRRVVAIIVGILLHLFIFKMGDVLITRFMIAPNPDLVALYEDFNEGKIESKEAKQERVEQVAEYISPLIWATVALVVLSPMLTGGLVGVLFNNVMAAAWGLGLGTLSILMMFDAGGVPFKSFLVLLISIGIAVFLMSRIISSRDTGENARNTLENARTWVLLGGLGALLAVIVYDTIGGAGGGASLKLILGTLIFAFMQAVLGGVGAMAGMKFKGKLR